MTVNYGGYSKEPLDRENPFDPHSLLVSYQGIDNHGNPISESARPMTRIEYNLLIKGLEYKRLLDSAARKHGDAKLVISMLEKISSDKSN